MLTGPPGVTPTGLPMKASTTPLMVASAVTPETDAPKLTVIAWVVAEAW